MLQKFARWREDKMGREPRASTLNIHNSALNRIFDEAITRGYMNKSQIPVLVNKGRDSVRRPDFTREEYATLIRKLPSWIDAGREGKSRDMRHLLRDYILILANTGMRHGTEVENLCWKHISLFEDKGLKYLEMSVSGKTGRRDIICRAGTINHLKRIQSRCPDIAHLSFERLIKSKLDEPVFRLPNGTACANLRQTFRILMRDTGTAHLSKNRSGSYPLQSTSHLCHVLAAKRWHGCAHARGTNGNIYFDDRASLQPPNTRALRKKCSQASATARHMKTTKQSGCRASRYSMMICTTL